MTCFKCKQEGHWARNCPNGDLCLKCGESGHWAKDCTNERRRRCGECRAFGHTKAACPVVREREACKAAEAERRAQEAAERARALWTDPKALRTVCGKHAFIEDVPHREHCDGQVWVGGHGGQSMTCGPCSAKRAIVAHLSFVDFVRDGNDAAQFDRRNLREYTPAEVVERLPWVEGKSAAESMSRVDASAFAYAVKHMDSSTAVRLFNAGSADSPRPRGAAQAFGPRDFVRSLQSSNGAIEVWGAFVNDDDYCITLQVAQKEAHEGGSFLIHLRTDTDEGDALFEHMADGARAAVHQWGPLDPITNLRRCKGCGVAVNGDVAPVDRCNGWKHVGPKHRKPPMKTGSGVFLAEADSCFFCEKTADWSHCGLARRNPRGA